ncbi:MAG: hypothetical protein A2Y64_07360 [Candidatus Coatesbacteria bacterium RBG_13_66_14]|uniref:ThuA-like domain-containing protein n=1 Tax=Candidatus Coatesbacteria bacterium RBG_13_66_14 TaxID=1817816 RepID=A0A1F5EWJ8_9BACT|nr:MAG: hypothetical protein A2Y64_07360 [Candidatus Coatesbacteria bacterium RBG_13_66_14]
MKKLVLFLVLVVAAAFAGQHDLLICHCDPGGISDVVTNIANDPYYDTVDFVDCTSYTPTVAEMEDYDCVFTWSNFEYDNSTGMGDNLADYMDGGSGGVVSCCFAHNSSDGYGLSGRYASDAAYCPVGRGTEYFAYTYMGNYDDTHPILDGVESITGIYYWQYINEESGATWLAELDNNFVLAAISADEKAVGLNLYPGDYHYWDGDGWILYNNAIKYMMGGWPGVEEISWGLIKAQFE